MCIYIYIFGIYIIIKTISFEYDRFVKFIFILYTILLLFCSFRHFFSYELLARLAVGMNPKCKL